MLEVIPSLRAEYETAAPWLPEEVVTIPYVTCFLLNCNIAFVAPLILNEPVF